MEVVKGYLGEGGSLKADEEEEEDKENIQNLSLDNIKIGRVYDGVVKKDLNPEEMEYGSCCDSSHDEGNSILHNFR